VIIDAHCHLGTDVVFDMETNEQDLLECCRSNGIDGGIVQPFIGRPYISETKKIHNRIKNLCLENSNRFWGMASINPHFTARDYDEEAERCICDLGFVGIKITPIAHAVNMDSKDSFHVFEVAKKLNVPVMVHTGMGIPFSDPAALYPPVKKFGDVSIVIAHGGANFFTKQAIYLAQAFENVTIEPSGAGIEATELILNAIGSKRVMFSSDVRLQAPIELAKYRYLLSGEELDQVLYKTANRVFGLKLCKNS
jgi:predicted TIM-barrel fold metal-dependent hydrolase